jgi:hypothetical protein
MRILVMEQMEVMEWGEVELELGPWTGRGSRNLPDYIYM